VVERVGYGRKRHEQVSGRRSLILAVRGKGYRFDVSDGMVDGTASVIAR
jgi:hypothetical protein